MSKLSHLQKGPHHGDGDCYSAAGSGGRGGEGGGEGGVGEGWSVLEDLEEEEGILR